jgi:hypothetical protein
MVNRYTELLANFEAQPVYHLSTFFHEHAAQIDTLIQLYEVYNRHVMNVQNARIRELHKMIRMRTGDDAWSDMEGLELTYDHFDPALCIRGGFVATPEDPLSTFTIHIITPDIQAWNHYEDQLLQQYPGKEPLILGNKTLLPVLSIPGQDTAMVLSALEEVYTCLSSLHLRTFLVSLTSH